LPIAAVTTIYGKRTMSIDRTLQLKTFYLQGMAAAWNEWQAAVGSQQKPVIPEAWLDRLIAAEQAGR